MANPLHLTGGVNKNVDRRVCLAELDRALDFGDSAAKAAFLEKWGEELREFLMGSCGPAPILRTKRSVG